MKFRPDMIVRASDGQPVLAVEAKNVRNLGEEEAIALRQHFLEGGTFFRLPYFLLVSQDRGYLWKGGRKATDDARPVREFPMQGVVKRYFPDESDPFHLHEEVLEILVQQWLNILTIKGHASDGEAEQALSSAGVLNKIKGGSVETQTWL